MFEVESADQAVVFLEKGAAEMLYPVLEGYAVNMAYFRKAFGGLRVIAFAGRRRRHVVFLGT